MKELAAFSIKDIRTAYTIYQVMDKAGITIEEIGEYSATAPRPKGEQKKKQKKQENVFLKSGESEMTMLLCACGGQMIIEALCSSRAVKEKCVRIAICSECPNEVKIR